MEVSFRVGIGNSVDDGGFVAPAGEDVADAVELGRLVEEDLGDVASYPGRGAFFNLR